METIKFLFMLIILNILPFSSFSFINYKLHLSKTLQSYVLENYYKEVVQSCKGYEGEIGNMIILPNDPSHPSLNAGSLEVLAGCTAIAQLVEGNS